MCMCMCMCVQEAKASSVMNLELADYQHSLQTLEEKLLGVQRQLDQSRETEKEQQGKMESMRKEMGQWNVHSSLVLILLSYICTMYMYIVCMCTCTCTCMYVYMYMYVHLLVNAL